MREREIYNQKVMLLMMLLALASTSLIANAKVYAEPQEAHPANSIWTEPSSLTINITKVNVGYTFNVTVWLNITDNSFSWQVKLLFNTTYFNATRVGYTAGSVSNWATHRTGGGTVPVPPVIDNKKGYVLFGESCIGSDYVPGPVTASLMWVEFILKETPPLNHLTVNFSVPYGKDTFILNPDLEIINVQSTKGTEIPVIPELRGPITPAILLLLSTTIIIIAKRKFER